MRAITMELLGIALIVWIVTGTPSVDAIRAWKLPSVTEWLPPHVDQRRDYVREQFDRVWDRD